jgi:protein-tyrosine phosphatase
VNNRAVYHDRSLDHHLISESPTRLYMGELPRDYTEVPAPVVVNLCGMSPGGAPYGRIVLGLPLLDSLDESLLPERGLMERFLAGVHLHSQRQPSYWHCHAGINRSGFAVAAYLHLYRGLRISDAITELRERRTGMVLCNQLFERTLREWYGAPHEQAFEPTAIEMYLRERLGKRKDP